MNDLVRVIHVVALCLLMSTAAHAQQWSATVDGVTAYFGVVRSELARDMQAVHGATNAVGFALCAVLGWRSARRSGTAGMAA